MRVFVWGILCAAAAAGAVPVDLTGVRPGPVNVQQTATAVSVTWPDEAGRSWTAEFSLDPKAPLITSIGVGGHHIIERAKPYYQCTTGKRRGGFDQFFDFPPSHPEGTRSSEGAFELGGVRAQSIGDRVELLFEGMKLGIFQGTIRYQFFPGSRLIEQAAVVSTKEPDTAYIYSAGLRMAVDAQCFR